MELLCYTDLKVEDSSSEERNVNLLNGDIIILDDVDPEKEEVIMTLNKTNTDVVGRVVRVDLKILAKHFKKP